MATFAQPPRLSLPPRTVDECGVRAGARASRALSKRVGLVSFVLVVVAGAVLPARSCGPDLPEAVFVSRQTPDDPKAFGSGQLGIVLPDCYQRYLYLAY